MGKLSFIRTAAIILLHLCNSAATEGVLEVISSSLASTIMDVPLANQTVFDHGSPYSFPSSIWKLSYTSPVSSSADDWQVEGISGFHQDRINTKFADLS